MLRDRPPIGSTPAQSSSRGKHHVQREHPRKWEECVRQPGQRPAIALQLLRLGVILWDGTSKLEVEVFNRRESLIRGRTEESFLDDLDRLLGLEQRTQRTLAVGGTDQISRCTGSDSSAGLVSPTAAATSAAVSRPDFPPSARWRKKLSSTTRPKVTDGSTQSH